MNRRILYAGDSHLGDAAAYLAGVLTHAGLHFEYVPSDAPLPAPPGGMEPHLYIFSDYPGRNLTDADVRRIIGAVESGSGFMMIGGWESFHGAAGEYHDSPLADVLPVRIQPSDDRVNAPQPCLLEKRIDHPILAGLPLDRPPGIGGYNRVRAKPEADVVLSARHVEVDVARGNDPSGAVTDDDTGVDYTFTLGARVPLLVVGTHGRGRVAAFASDVAPHWVGGLVDWGPDRVRTQAAGAASIEVGSLYAEFFTRLVRWTMGDDLLPR